MTSQAKRNHYVPEWYQRRFLVDGKTHFHLLDRTPPTRVSPEGAEYRLQDMRRLGPPSCFVQDDLYTLKVGRLSSDAIETGFFGVIDRNGKKAVEFFADYGIRAGADAAFQDLVDYMNAQRFRTPRGLEALKFAMDLKDQNLTLAAMQHVFRMHATMWSEGVWEIVRATRSPTKFVLTDDPIAFYNQKAFPLSVDCLYPSDVSLGAVGTRTLFPLSHDALLIITHLQLVRNPWMNPLRARANARTFEPPMPFDLRKVQVDRELEEDEVLRVNLILKKRATRFVAAAEREWLFPEERVSTEHWSKLDKDLFLHPNPFKVDFSTGFFARLKDGSAWGGDEYGRSPGHPDYEDKDQSQREWRLHLKAQLEWALKREGRSLARVFEFDDGYNNIMQRALDRHHEERRNSKAKRRGKR